MIGAMEPKTIEDQPAQSSDSIAAAIAHEVNNLLTPVIGLADLLQHTDGDDSVRDQLIERAVDRCQRAVSICALLLELAKDGEPETPVAPLEPVLASAIEGARSHADVSGVEVQTLFEGPGALRVPHSVAEHILLNLLLNAVAASASGDRVTIAVEFRPATAWLGARWAIQISDSGAGLDARSVARINGGGLPEGSKGIGLAVVRLLCRRWGGRLSVDSELGAGSTFHVELPAA